MDLDLSEEQRLLKDGVERLMREHYSFEDRRKYRSEKSGFSDAMWARYAELGLLGLPFSEADGGLGAGAVETMIVMEAFGKALILEPYFATVVLAGGILRHAANEAQKANLIPSITEGRMKLALAYAEPQSRYDLFDVETRATKDGDGWVLNGTKGLVLHGDVADKIIVSARTAGGTREMHGIGLFLVDANAPGLVRRGYPTQDGLRAAEISLNNVRIATADVIGEPTRAFPIISRVADEAIAAMCAEAVGCFAEMHAITVNYLKTRKQFGTTIGSFQVLQHRAVDMFVELEQSRSMSMFATMMAGESDATERERALSAAKAQIGQSSKALGRQAIQLHGGIGMTMEYSIGHYFKHVTMIDTLFGDTDHHLQRLASLGGLFGEQAIQG
ncbi:acyl-CoA dehydrogenase family protein [Bradyrhizobium canariense]|uniref:Pimeloyl-CoA dehydrogenase small subunit n=1 Tax=Bradyrhizobium canariense TaxID=255045 RepID=A0A1X3HBK0_9BRAD|nr:acyl-CoA dehydrogenase family protein [Bradyrhizobium canariense]OSI73203.1 pimeloyl-CoA dehydrogenase small subunit [Bradyrhizobium canariense]OSI81305.1 pimeloyl-CoA dehydrogenase small subunit [Bradyrhizobium canariense]OSI94580.1 pimeloyl-CoA dehydrogenase small subunit [Bradyrhizobium canariense]OSI95168.1 pimeloyl-CoA dehydrogenase small subunit [Bradyrhizobium canariense]OSJ08213.1 pimeloyl-CoA dehydrogenase small subunit [Bradyrhizobium canariense]